MLLHFLLPSGVLLSDCIVAIQSLFTACTLSACMQGVLRHNIIRRCTHQAYFLPLHNVRYWWVCSGHCLVCWELPRHTGLLHLQLQPWILSEWWWTYMQWYVDTYFRQAFGFISMHACMLAQALMNACWGHTYAARTATTHQTAIHVAATVDTPLTATDLPVMVIKLAR